MKKRRKTKKTRRPKRTKKTKKLKKITKAKKPKRVVRAKKIKKPKKARKIRKIKKIAKTKIKPVERPKEIKKVPEVEKVEITEKPTPVPKVPYTQENAMLCMCNKCPVQAESMCAKEKMEKIQAMLQGGIMPPPEDLPMLYCSSGIATCADLDVAKMCMCSDCPVWAKYNLTSGRPVIYFCRDGKAE